VDSNASSIGCAFRSERLRRGKDLDGIAAETKISRVILEAIENDRFESLPGGAYRRGFVRQYARALGLDEEKAVAEFQREHLELPVALPPIPPERPFRHLREVAFLLLPALAIVGFYKVASTDHAEKKRTIVERIPKTVVPAAPPPATVSANENPPALPVHAVLTMTEPVWVSVSCDGKPAYTGTLLEKESRSFEATATVTVLVGNAGGLTITLNGQPIGPIGAHGEIQFLELTPSGTHHLPRARKTPPPSDSEPTV